MARCCNGGNQMKKLLAWLIVLAFASAAIAAPQAAGDWPNYGHRRATTALATHAGQPRQRRQLTLAWEYKTGGGARNRQSCAEPLARWTACCLSTPLARWWH
jgi:hypothetical protein